MKKGVHVLALMASLFAAGLPAAGQLSVISNTYLEGLYGTMPQNMRLPLTWFAVVENTTSTVQTGITADIVHIGPDGTTSIVASGAYGNIAVADTDTLVIDGRGFYYDEYPGWYGFSDNYGASHLLPTNNGVPTGVVGTHRVFARIHTNAGDILCDTMEYVVSSANASDGTYTWAWDEGQVLLNRSYALVCDWDGNGYDRMVDSVDIYYTPYGAVPSVRYTAGSDSGYFVYGVELVPSRALPAVDMEGARIYILCAEDRYYENELGGGNNILRMDSVSEVYHSVTLGEAGTTIRCMFTNPVYMSPNKSYRLRYALEEEHTFALAAVENKKRASRFNAILQGYCTYWTGTEDVLPAIRALVKPASSWHRLSVVSADTNFGTAQGSGVYPTGDTITITAVGRIVWDSVRSALDTVAAFSHWQDGNTDNPRRVVVSGDASYTAYFAYQVTAKSADTSMGRVSGGGVYDDGTNVTLSAIPATGYHFIHWNDGSRANPRTITVSGSATYTAYFGIDTLTINVASSNSMYGIVTGGGEFTYGSPCTLEATPFTGYRFAGWSNGVAANPYIFPATESINLTAFFVAEGEQAFTVTAASASPEMGTATVNGGATATVSDGETVTLRAAGNPGYHFLRWHDGNTDSVRTVVVTADMTFTAYFAEVVGIDGIVAGEAAVRVADGAIVVLGAAGAEVRVYDVQGRLVAARRGAEMRLAVPAAGVYLVKVGDAPARRVVVLN